MAEQRLEIEAGYRSLKIDSQVDVALPDSHQEYTYKMNHATRGIAVIINNVNFKKLDVRRGSDIDAAGLYQRFKIMGFDVKHYKNLTTTEMRKKLIEVAAMDHSNHDCFVCAILSHGDEDGNVYGYNGPIQIDILVDPFKGENCKTLLEKPKLFFIQACRGTKFDGGAVVSDSAGEEMMAVQLKIRRIPIEADILMAFSTVPGYFAWRKAKGGSWFVQALVKVLEQYGSTKEILWILTRVNYHVAYDYESKSSRMAFNNLKEVPCIQSMLTKELYFYDK